MSRASGYTPASDNDIGLAWQRMLATEPYPLPIPRRFAPGAQEATTMTTYAIDDGDCDCGASTRGHICPPHATVIGGAS